MSLKNVVSFPHRSGSCRICRECGRLCSKCEKFVNQDWVRQSGGIIADKMLMKLTDEASARDFWLPDTEEMVESCTTEDFEQYLKTTPLSPQQRRIVFLLTIEGRTNDEIAKELKITPGSVRSQRQRIIEKIRFCQSPAIYRREKSEVSFPEPPAPEPEIADPDEEPDEQAVPNRQLLRRVCPRCRDRLFLACKNYQYCMNCFWNSDQDL